MVQTHRARTIAAAGILTTTLAIGGCATIGQLFGGGAPQRDDETNQVTESADVDVFQLQVRDCLSLGDDSQLSSASVVPCSEPHTDEIYHEFELPDGDWPGEEAVQQAADEGCYNAFEPFVGKAYEESVLEYIYLTPTEAGWTDTGLQDRLIQCVVYEPGDGAPVEIEGSLEGSAR
ncbi:septum formation family protein [Microbacterium lacusdiani]